MSIRDGERGQSVQIGAVILFAGLVLLLATYQAVAVPAQNRGVEFDHNQQVRDDLLDLRNAVASTLGDATRQSVSVRLGTTYPSRVLAVNPPPATGHLRTVGTADGDVAVGIANAKALDGETDDYWNGTERTYGTGAIAYRPDYNEYERPPSTVYESSVLYDAFAAEGTTVARSGQALVDGDRVTLVALNGSLQRSASGAASVDVRPVSASSTTVTVRNAEPDANVTLRVPTRLSEDRWEELLADEFVDEGGNVTADGVRTTPLPGTPDYELLEIEFVPGTYELQLAKAGVGTRVTETGPAYLTGVSGNGSTVPEGGSQRLVVEVRDRYNNPVSGVTVSATASQGRFEDDAVRTGGDGRAVFRYRAPDVSGATDVPVAFSYGSGTDAETVEMTVTVQDTGVGGGSGGASGAPYALEWQSPTEDNAGDHLSDCDASACTWDVGADADDRLSLRALAETLDADPAPIEDLAVDFALDNASVATLGSSGTGPGGTDANGEATLALRAEANGTVSVFAAGGDASDRINVTVENVTAGVDGPTVAARVDDFSDRNPNDPHLVASYDVRDANGSFERVEASFESSGGPSGTYQSADARGSFSFQPGYGDGRQFEVTVDVIYADERGAEYVAASETITDAADARNPTDQNADLSEPTSATLTDYSVEDRSNVNANRVRYRFDYAVSASGSFDRARLFVLNLNRNGATEVRDESSRSGTNVDINPGFGADTQYRVGIAVYDADGAIVDVVDVIDAADGDPDGPVLSATLALLGLAVVGHALRRLSTP